uniref:Cytochrome c biogenesis protein CcsA n=1 Tax=Nephroselmis olivacea TaxID=31312 RepID=Q9T373_NEPOL|nr:cytochrome c biogenesis protein [Nephroselmis olivacea]NP_050934.1 cytochrome c biogenesis protein [Nephroselmis olivacea]AAD54884.1 protein involved in cytochrome c biogenesis [Nephroselmis olivacea]AAD54905.1 protein involved in cytochrome c biogenesis [Nephroselmis olivacea]
MSTFSILSLVAFATLFVTMLLYFFQRQPLARQSMWIAHTSLAGLLLLRWVQSGHFPLSNLYESCLFLSWAVTLGHFVVEKDASRAGFLDLGIFTAPMAFFVYAFATFSLPPTMQEAGPLVPALRSHWLMMHVTLMILSYAALLFGSVLSLAFLVITTGPRKNSEKLQSLASTFDTLSYRTLGIGFPLLTVGILSGAVWANEAWGSYWSWDPKETWALITWLIFAIYLHSRLTYGWNGQKAALIASVGFFLIWICYLGVNLLGKGLHSYGWLTS